MTSKYLATLTPSRKHRAVFSWVFTLVVCYSIEFYGPNKAAVRHDSAAQKELSVSAVVKKKEGDGIGSWQLVDWQYPITDDEELRFNCEMATFKSSTSEKEAQMCVHDFAESISTYIKRDGNWIDCNILPSLWNEGGHDGDTTDESLDYYYVDIGTNIGSCVMEMLLGTDAKIIAFEPHPMNVYNLKKTISQLDKSYQDRLMLFPIGLGDATGTATIYSANNNMGNSVIDKIIKDGRPQKFDEKYQFTIHVERLDSILDSNNINVKLLKMDAQGYECKILEGMGADLAEKIDIVKFEYAGQWLRGHGCMDILQRVRKYRFNIYKKYENGNFLDWLDGEKTNLGGNMHLDLFASKSKRRSIVKIR
mmetsp:Transcript_1084/g.2250  ORF Transcript_1084/g.2250 Transcript_1084/m.2250 type:complete len:364 (-) Transcript_1084:103-1194(-)|eukprot:CAMPEP_0172326580 /NCGR_PEP_ID=MMETSP1058-20130122/56948_1 /TAXON_ID=83371 /ORGANISM="Detonula confervacea, Strain CCMP 353" /LENGTH=363 /DNA_ID=CAMNT_0013043395 /DNA_START=174 /DNA_END=1265 /DNA_ORIENTATION=+